jgi:TIR domain-containing protein
MQMLSPSERIKLIKEISHRLSSEEWQIIDLSLKQFSLPWDDDWSGSKEAYIIEMISTAEDDVLFSLARHVGYDYDNVRSKVEPDFWRPGHLRLFISHLATFRADAAAIQADLQKFQISSFVAHNDIEPTTEWQNEIEAALATSDAMVVLLRKGFHKSNWTDQEIGYAMGRKILIITVRFEEDPYGFIGRFQALNGNGKESRLLASEIFDILRKHKQTHRRAAEALVARMEQSDSFAEARDNIALLEKVTYWDKSFNGRLEAAIESNGQISGAWGVPDRIKRLISS